jgi:hypothetical protein
MLNSRIGLAFLVILLAAGGLASSQEGAIRGVHDPVMVHEMDLCYVAPDGESYVGRNQNGLTVRGRR